MYLVLFVSGRMANLFQPKTMVSGPDQGTNLFNFSSSQAPCFQSNLFHVKVEFDTCWPHPFSHQQHPEKLERHCRGASMRSKTHTAFTLCRRTL